MANRTIYTRAYLKSSARQFVSAKGPKGDPLSDTALVQEFRNHADKWNRKPTALVSGSDRIVDTLKRAFDKHYKDGESPADIWIAFIEVPPTINDTAPQIHSAKELAEKCGLEKPNKFSHEVVFEWAIPEKYVVHEVSLQTLMKRGLQEHCLLQPSTLEVRRHIARELQRHDLWEIGITLGVFAQKFGARAPLSWISRQLFYDCVRAKIVDDDMVSDGINTSLCDWWLSDIDFFIDYEEFKEWRDVTEDSMTWDLIDFWETWHDVNCDGIIQELYAKEKLAYDKEKNKLLVEHEKKRAAIEAEAVKIGL